MMFVIKGSMSSTHIREAAYLFDLEIKLNRLFLIAFYATRYKLIRQLNDNTSVNK